MIEKKLQQKVIQICKQRDILCMKIDSSSSRGWPDLIIMRYGKPQFYVELKTATGRLSKLQMHMHEQIRKNGGEVYVIRTTEDFIALIS